MPRKKDGMPFEVHPTPAKGKDGKNIVYEFIYTEI